ncbi:alpha/beta hydrolase family protein [Pedobacter paludis]|uniref:Peptidase S9 prolyl oligopeptidase catalytic domain-containing protein n=1 Tax=Pedobacter paludis TaxID=2203212 RepID=A0A317F1R7_9SPHI|nr:prolyl oligopeptidase family serine peptidase [Pedobacter paludis]PWS32203.1 hypothetical protein DF947_10565 [Pedobacter paludis]
MNIYKLTQTFLTACVLSIGISHSQNIPLDFNALDTWPRVSEGRISTQGNYFSYDISRANRPLETVLKSMDGKWVKHLTNVYEKNFSYKPNEFWYRSGDTLFTQHLGTAEVSHTVQLKDYKQFSSKGRFYEVLYLKNGSLTVADLSAKRQLTLRDVSEFRIDSDNDFIVVQSSINTGVNLNIINLSRFDSEQITVPQTTTDIIFDKSYLKVAYLDDEERIISIDLKSKSRYVSRPIPDIESLKSFASQDIILYTLKNPSESHDKENDIVDVWDYKAPLLKSAQLAGVSYLKNKSIGVYNTDHDSYFIANSDTEAFESLGSTGYAFISKVAGIYSERYWNDSAYVRSTLLNLRTMEKKIVDLNYVRISPNGKFIVGYNEKLQDFIQVDLNTMVSLPLTLNLAISSNREHNYPGDSLKRFVTFGGFTKSGDIIIYDDYDIWLLDKDHKRPARNLTDFKGRDNHTIFRFVELRALKPDVTSETALLTGFSFNDNKNNFYSLSGRGLKKLSNDGFFYGLDNMGEFPGTQMVKASGKDLWLVKRESSTQQPNYAFTNNFKDFMPVSDMNPAIRYNWPRVQLFSYPTRRQKTAKGLIYFPQGFDKQKKYPVIFQFYEVRSYKQNLFLFPDYAHDEINIPWMVNQDYVVFVPDIEVEAGRPGESIMDCIMGGYDFIKSQQWADTLRVGLNGHSYGANEVLHIITQTNKFAAAVAVSGLSDLVAAIGNVTQGDGMPYHREWAERGQGRIGATLWDNPEIYLKNSPVLQSYRVTTPLLLVNNKKDDIIDFSQGVEMFTALRRQRKKVWLLQYRLGAHSIYHHESEVDFTKKLDDFYNFFLKKGNLKRWMGGDGASGGN